MDKTREAAVYIMEDINSLNESVRDVAYAIVRARDLRRPASKGILFLLVVAFSSIAAVATLGFATRADRFDDLLTYAILVAAVVLSAKLSWRWARARTDIHDAYRKLERTLLQKPARERVVARRHAYAAINAMKSHMFAIDIAELRGSGEAAVRDVAERLRHS